MAKTNGSSGIQTEIQDRAGELQHFVAAQLDEARKQFAKLEKELVTKGRAQRKELEQLINRVRSGKELKAFRTRANTASNDVKHALDGLQEKVVSAVGVASKTQVASLKGDLNKLSKKIDALVKKQQGVA